VKTVVADRHSNIATIRHSPLALRQSPPFSVVADSLMADTRVCPYHSLFAIRYSLPFLPVANRQSLPFDQSPIANRQSLPFCYSLPLRDCDKFWDGGA
jgi:hypothetical protein